MMVLWGLKHVVATEINQVLQVTLVYLIEYCCVDGQSFSCLLWYTTGCIQQRSFSSMSSAKNKDFEELLVIHLNIKITTISILFSISNGIS
jgi:hypothetical protein